jgi:hypothetical protein
MQTLRRFLVIQALMLWQGGFLFYAAVVVPIVNDVSGPLDQGQITRHVTDRMNLIAIGTLVILLWDQWVNGGRRQLDRIRWICWIVMVIGLVGLFAVHSTLEDYFNATDDPFRPWAFYHWRRVYLCIVTVQWIAGLVYVTAMLLAWGADGRARSATRGRESH